MKMTKKVLFGALAALAMAGFTGCDGLASYMKGETSLSDAFQKEAGNKDLIKYSDNTSTSKWTISGTNESDTEQVRALKFLQTKHLDMAGLARMDTASGGVIGVVFNATRTEAKDDEGATLKDDDGNTVYSYSFGVAAFGRSSGLPYTYVSYFANIKDTDLEKYNFGAWDETKKKAVKLEKVDASVTTPYEVVYQDLTTLKAADVLKCTVVDGEKTTYTAVIDVDQNDDGSYTINFYGADAVGKNDTFDPDKLDEGVTAIGDPVTMSAASLGKEKAAQYQCGVYAMVNKPKCTLEGTLSILDLTKDANIAE